ncbi:hypothetical protein KAR91_80765 [Candidatus Pacearchaeota archaeon]|nr:hypothetical protein [Candidatus Pacearchaeota archaeon]
MNTTKDLMEMLTAIKLDRDLLEDRQQKVFVKLSKLCPIQLGETIKVTGATYNGKKMQVIRVGVADNRLYPGPSWEWIITGFVLNRNGIPGRLTAETRMEIK